MAIETAGIVARYRSSGLTQKAFCASESISISTLQYHLQKSKRAETVSAKNPGFISLSAPNASESRSVVVVRGRLGIAEICTILQAALES
jgi:hypothetical protein